MRIYIKIKTLVFICIISLYNTSICAIDNSLIKKIQANLAKLDKVAIEFLQIDKQNTIAEGQLLIEKPYFFRFNYYDPHPLLITGGKKYITIYDYDMESISHLDRSGNLINIIFSDDWLLNKYFKIIKTTEDPQYFVVKILYLENQKRVDLFFYKKTLNLAKINISEIDEISVTISFDEPIKVINFKPGTFSIKNPAIFGPPKRLNKYEIRQIYDTS
jgi:outer membrane lipoprotein-sorting protein